MSGDTVLWDALALARDSLVQYSAKYPKAKLRIVCLSDGEDTKSKQVVHYVAHYVAADLVRDHITVDSFCLGIANMDTLQAVLHMTGGYKFQPYQLEHAMAFCELEPVLSIHERPDTVLPKFHPRHYAKTRLGQAKTRMRLDVVSRDIFPCRKEHPLLDESYIALRSVVNASSNFSMANRSDNNMRLARIHNEIRNSAAKVHPYYDIYVCESNIAVEDCHAGTTGQHLCQQHVPLVPRDGRQLPHVPAQGSFRDTCLPSEHQPTRSHLPLHLRPQLDG